MTILIMIAMIIITVTITNIILQATEEAGGNVLLLGHAATLDTCSRQLVGIVLSILDDQYESFSDVGEIRVWFASKILTPCRMH